MFGYLYIMSENFSNEQQNLSIGNPSSPLQKKTNKEKTHKVILLVISTVLLSFLSGFIAGGAAYFLTSKIVKTGKLNNFQTNNSKNQEIIKERLIEEDSTVIEAVEKNSPAVVSIIISKDVPRFRSFFFDDPFSFDFDPFGFKKENETEKQKIGGGSGFFVSSDGMIVTNKHVVSDVSAEYTVVTNDGKEYKAKVLARHPYLDIAIMEKTFR